MSLSNIPMKTTPSFRLAL